jgi:transketolase
MRTTFINRLIELARSNDKIVLIVGDLGYGVVEPFFREFPDRSFNAGVSEQNMIGVSAGLASEGMHVFVYSIANFPTFRCAEQIRNDVAYHNLSVTVVSVGGGVAYGNLGYSHHAVQDYALMRSFPNMLIASPGDPTEVSFVLDYLVCNPQPSYLRLGKNGEPILRNPNENLQLNPGIWVPYQLSQSSELALITTGATLEIASQISKSGNPKTIDVYSMPLWGMSFKDLQPDQLSKYKTICVLEDHLLDGGFGSWLLEATTLAESIETKIVICSLREDVCGDVGSQVFLREKHGLNIADVQNKIFRN